MKKLVAFFLIVNTMFSCSDSPTVTKKSIETVNQQNQMIFVWALNGILNHENQTSDFIFGGEEKNIDNRNHYRKSLKEWWDILDKESLTNTIELLKNGEMHHQAFLNEYQEFFTYNEAQFQIKLIDNPANNEFNQIIRENSNFYQEKGLLAWDMVRAIGLIGWGFQADYISQEEAYNLCLDVGKKIQSNFSTYHELVDNYCTGYLFWSGDYIDYKNRKKTATYLLDNPKSAWNIFPFDYDLERKIQ